MEAYQKYSDFLKSSKKQSHYKNDNSLMCSIIVSCQITTARGNTLSVQLRMLVKTCHAPDDSLLTKNRSGDNEHSLEIYSVPITVTGTLGDTNRATDTCSEGAVYFGEKRL